MNAARWAAAAVVVVTLAMNAGTVWVLLLSGAIVGFTILGVAAVLTRYHEDRRLGASPRIRRHLDSPTPQGDDRMTRRIAAVVVWLPEPVPNLPPNDAVTIPGRPTANVRS